MPPPGTPRGTPPPAPGTASPGVPAAPAAPRRRFRSFWRGFARPVRYAVLLAGALPVLAFPDLNLEFLAWFGLVPGLLLLRAAPTAREAAIRGWWLGAGYLLAALYWLIPNIGPALLLVAIVLGAPWAAVGLAAWRLLRAPGPSAGQALAAIAVIPSCWVVIDWIRSWHAIGGPWAVFGASQWQHPAVLALAAVGGVWLITLALVAASTGIVVALTAARPLGRLLGAAGAIVAIAAGPASFWLTAGEHAGPPAGHLSLALVQPGLQDSPMATVAQERRLTLGVRGADLIVWAESSVGYDLYADHALLRALSRLSATVSTQLLVSQDALSPSGAKSKVAVLIGPRGIEGTYTKTRLVPFGEYIPLRPALGWLVKISRAAPVNMISGNGARVLHATLPDGRRLDFGVLICFESSFPDMSRADVNHGAQVLIFQTSDSTFQGSWAPQQHASLAALRAAETGRPAVQAALTGDTAAFDARGRQLAWAGTSERGVVRVTLALPRASVRTPFDRYGDIAVWIAVAVVVIAAMRYVPARSLIRRFRRALPIDLRRDIASCGKVGLSSAAARAYCGATGVLARWVARRSSRGQSAIMTPGTTPGSRVTGRRGVEVSMLRRDDRSRPRMLAPVALAGLAGLVAAGCQSASGHTSGGASGAGSPSAPAARISITPASGSTRVKPGKGITVTVADGKLSGVTVTGDQVPGTLNAARTQWTSTWALPVDKRLTVTATAVSSSGRTVTQASTFRTLTPAQTFTTMIFEGYRQTYGVGMPIILNFSHPITNRAAVERSLQITTSKPVVGAWYWDTSQTLVFRPRDYWPPHTSVSFAGHLNGVEGAPGVYGAHMLTQQFSIGRSLIVVASASKHHMKLYRAGKLIRSWPISTGRPGDDTPNGTYLTIEKGNPVLMKGPGYAIEVPWSVRFTWTGDYLHDAYWSVGEQGFVNVSHGCVNMAPADAEYYYKMAVPGDPVTITGSPKSGTWDNGWTEWFLTWKQLVKGSALHEAVLAGPQGSTLVSPATLPASTASAPLGKSKPGNARAG